MDSSKNFNLTSHEQILQQGKQFVIDFYYHFVLGHVEVNTSTIGNRDF